VSNLMREQFEKALINLQQRLDRGDPVHTDELEKLKLIRSILEEKFEGQRSVNAKDVTPKED